MKKLKCVKCNHQWYPRTPKPVQCPKCRTVYWEKEKENDNSRRGKKTL